MVYAAIAWLTEDLCLALPCVAMLCLAMLMAATKSRETGIALALG